MRKTSFYEFILRKYHKKAIFSNKV